MQIGGEENACVVAIWRSLEGPASYSAPVVVEKNGRKVLIVWAENHLAGLNPESGSQYWSIPWKQKMGMAILRLF